MKTKLVFSTETKDTEQWTDLPFIPRIHEWVNALDILKPDEIEKIKHSAKCWSGVRGIVESIKHKHDNNEFCVEVLIWCED